MTQGKHTHRKFYPFNPGRNQLGNKIGKNEKGSIQQMTVQTGRRMEKFPKREIQMEKFKYSGKWRSCHGTVSVKTYQVSLLSQKTNKYFLYQLINNASSNQKTDNKSLLNVCSPVFPLEA